MNVLNEQRVIDTNAQEQSLQFFEYNFNSWSTTSSTDEHTRLNQVSCLKLCNELILLKEVKNQKRGCIVLLSQKKKESNSVFVYKQKSSIYPTKSQYFNNKYYNRSNYLLLTFTLQIIDSALR